MSKQSLQTLCKTYLELYNLDKILFLIGCYPSQDIAQYPERNHELPLKLLQHLGNNTLVLLIDGMYKTYPSKSFPMYRFREGNVFEEFLQGNLFHIIPHYTDSLDFSLSIECEKYIISFTGTEGPFEVMKMCNLPYEEMLNFNILENPSECSCMLSIDDEELLPTMHMGRPNNRYRELFKYLVFRTCDVDFNTIKVIFNKTMKKLFTSYSSLLRKKAANLHNKWDTQYLSQLDMWFLNMFDGDYEQKFNHVLDVFFGSDSLSDSHQSRDIHQLAKEFSNFERKVNPIL